MPAGRPTKYKEKYCEMLIEHMKQGYSFETFGAIVDCHKDTLYEWCAKHPEFSDAKKKGAAYSQMMWEKMGMQGMWNQYQGDSFNQALWMFNMKSRFKWRDRVEVSTEEGTKIELSYKPKKDK